MDFLAENLYRISRVYPLIKKNNEEPPCEKAVKRTFAVTERTEPYTFQGELENALQRYEREGFNHRVEEGRILRDIWITDWVVEINSFADFVALQASVKEPLVFDVNPATGQGEILIQDYYQ